MAATSSRYARQAGQGCSDYTGTQRKGDDPQLLGTPLRRTGRQRRSLGQPDAQRRRDRVRRGEPERQRQCGKADALHEQHADDPPARRAQRAHDREVVAPLVQRLRQRDEQPQRRRGDQQQREAAHEVDADAEHA